MSIAASSKVLNEMCYILICVDAYDDGEIRGRLFNSYFSDSMYFYNTVELLKTMEAIYNQFEYPHAGMNLRSLNTNIENIGKAIKGPPGMLKKTVSAGQIKKFNVKGKLATFRVRVMFRQNASWQGEIRWLEEQKTEEFQSVLEFLELIDSAFE